MIAQHDLRRRPMFAPVGFGVAATPWGAVQVAARVALAPRAWSVEQ
jgi:hypothetical protein